jgi:O-antigen/teichoic acid export membrane protein
MHVALPMLVQMVALPIAMQSDRLVLSHVTQGSELAEYNLASQLFGIVQQTIAAAGVALWPVFAKARNDRKIISPMRPTVVFFLVGLTAGALLAAASPWLVEFVGVGRISLPPILVLSYVAFIALQAAKYPTGMYMTDTAGLRFQVIPILVMVPINLGLSLLLAPAVGAAGPIIASTVCALVFQVLPNLLYVYRDMRRREAIRRPDPEVV